MSLLSLFGIQDALAAAPTAQQQGGFTSMIFMMVLFLGVFYFLLMRPQSKRAKEHRKMLSELAKGDEVVMNGGVVGKVSKLADDFATLALTDDVNVMVKKSEISQVLPKGTMKSV